MEYIAEATLNYLVVFLPRIDQELVNLLLFMVKILTQVVVYRFPDKILTFLLVLEVIFTSLVIRVYQVTINQVLWALA